MTGYEYSRETGNGGQRRTQFPGLNWDSEGTIGFFLNGAAPGIPPYRAYPADVLASPIDAPRQGRIR